MLVGAARAWRRSLWGYLCCAGGRRHARGTRVLPGEPVPGLPGSKGGGQSGSRFSGLWIVGSGLWVVAGPRDGRLARTGRPLSGSFSPALPPIPGTGTTAVHGYMGTCRARKTGLADGPPGQQNPQSPSPNRLATWPHQLLSLLLSSCSRFTSFLHNTLLPSPPSSCSLHHSASATHPPSASVFLNSTTHPALSDLEPSLLRQPAATPDRVSSPKPVHPQADRSGVKQIEG